MGYRTYHTVTAEPEMSDVQMHELAEAVGYGIESFNGGDDVKWYDEPEDMKEFSKRYPDQVFRVDGVGENQDDIWVHWYKNGAVQAWALEYEVPEQPPEKW